jgi:hypothetical protein
VRALADRLRADGIDARLDQHSLAPPEGWLMWMDGQIRTADFVFLLCTETYLQRIERQEEPGKGGAVLLAKEMRASHSHSFATISMEKTRIFISHRREDTALYAGRIYDRLVMEFGFEQVFFDIDTIPPVMTLWRWLTIADAAGRPRTRNPEDLVAIEKLALACEGRYA